MLIVLMLFGAGCLVFDGALAEYYNLEDESYDDGDYDDDDMTLSSYPGLDLTRNRRYSEPSRSQGPEHLEMIKDALHQIMPGNRFDDWEEESPQIETKHIINDSAPQNDDLTPIRTDWTSNTTIFAQGPQGPWIQDIQGRASEPDDFWSVPETPNDPYDSKIHMKPTINMVPTRSTSEMTADREREELRAYMNSMTGVLIGSKKESEWMDDEESNQFSLSWYPRVIMSFRTLPRKTTTTTTTTASPTFFYSLITRFNPTLPPTIKRVNETYPTTVTTTRPTKKPCWGSPRKTTGAAGGASTGKTTGAAGWASTGKTTGAAGWASTGKTTGAAGWASTGKTTGTVDGASTGKTTGAAGGASTGKTTGAVGGASTGKTTGAVGGASTGKTTGAVGGASTGKTTGTVGGASTGKTTGAVGGASTGKTTGAVGGASTGGTRETITGSITAIATTGTLPPCVTTTETTTTTITTTTTKKTTRPFDIEKFLDIIGNLTYDYYSNLTEQVNETLHKMGVPTCGTPSTTTELPTTTESKPVDYAAMSQYVLGKCFVCGLEDPGIPYNANCADAFAGDFLPLVPQDPRAKGQIARYRKYCRYKDIDNFELNTTMPRSIFGRWTGGCSVRWTDLSGVYTQRACRNRRQASTGRHFASKRMAKLEMTLASMDNGCIISPVASLLPLSRGISLFARFHACVCTGNWCNLSARPDSDVRVTAVMAALVVARTHGL